MGRQVMTIKFSEREIEALHYERFHHPHPRVRLKMEVLLLKSQGLPHQEIARLARVSANTLRSYLREYARGGIEQLKQLRVHRPKSQLSPHRQVLEAYFREHPPASIQEAMARIEELTGIKRRQTQTRKFLRTLGVRFLRMGHWPARDLPDFNLFTGKRIAVGNGDGITMDSA